MLSESAEDNISQAAVGVRRSLIGFLKTFGELAGSMMMLYSDVAASVSSYARSGRLHQTADT